MRVRSIPVNKRESNEEVARIPLPKAGDELPLIFCFLKKRTLVLSGEVWYSGDSQKALQFYGRTGNLFDTYKMDRSRIDLPDSCGTARLFFCRTVLDVVFVRGSIWTGSDHQPESYGAGAEICALE